MDTDSWKEDWAYSGGHDATLVHVAPWILGTLFPNPSMGPVQINWTTLLIELFYTPELLFTFWVFKNQI